MRLLALGSRPSVLWGVGPRSLEGITPPGHSLGDCKLLPFGLKLGTNTFSEGPAGKCFRLCGPGSVTTTQLSIIAQKQPLALQERVWLH